LPNESTRLPRAVIEKPPFSKLYSFSQDTNRKPASRKLKKRRVIDFIILPLNEGGLVRDTN